MTTRAGVHTGGPSARKVVTVSLLVDAGDVVTCLAVAILTGSAVVYAEMAQGVADVVGSLCLVVGERRALRPRDARHPLGYRREPFFWALLSAMIMLVLGGGLSLHRGYDQLVAPEALRRTWLALGVLGLLALLLYSGLGLVVFDALGALVVGVLIVALSGYLIADARALITGRAVPPRDLARIRAAVTAAPGVEALNDVAAVWSGRKEVRVELDLDLAERLDTPGIERLLDDLSSRIRAAVPEAQTIRVDLNSPEAAPAGGV